MRRAGLAFVLFFVAGVALLARADVAAEFPNANEVAADYPDEAERYAALSALWDYSHAKAADSPDAKAERATYYNAMTAIRQRYLVAGTADGFDQKVQGLDGPFGRSVLERYHLLGVQADAPPVRMVAHDVTDAMIRAAFFKALPFLIAGLVAMWVLMKMMARGVPGAEAPSSTGVVPLPEALRVVRVPGMTYSVAHVAGLVVDKESVVHTQHTTTTTAERDPFHLGAGPAPLRYRTNTATTSTRVDTLWVRRPDGGEAAWTFTGSGLQARPGHVISAIARWLHDGSSQFVAAYNHTTGQMEDLSANAHGARGGCLAWIVAVLVGSVPLGIAVGIFVSADPNSDPDPQHAMFLPLAYWIEGGFGAAFLGLFMILWMMSAAMRKRNAAFKRKYAPQFLAFFQQVSPELRGQFGAR